MTELNFAPRLSTVPNGTTLMIEVPPGTEREYALDLADAWQKVTGGRVVVVWLNSLRIPTVLAVARGYTSANPDKRHGSV